MWQTALLPFLQVTLWGCHGRGCLCLLDNWVNSFVIFRLFKMKPLLLFCLSQWRGRAELVRINQIKLSSGISSECLCAFFTSIFVRWLFFFAGFMYLFWTISATSHSLQLIIQVSAFSHGEFHILEQNSSLLVLLDFQEFPELKSCLTITSSQRVKVMGGFFNRPRGPERSRGPWARVSVWSDC